MEPFHYAGFWKRVAAHILDALCLSGVAVGVGLVLVVAPIVLGVPKEILMLLQLLLYLIIIAAGYLYYTLLESSEKQGTFGKQMMKLEVVNSDGDRISFAYANARFFSRFLTCMANYIFFAGILMMLFNTKKQVLHDMVTATCVVDASN